MSGHAIDAASPAGEATRLPWAGLLALAGGGFITLLFVLEYLVSGDQSQRDRLLKAAGLDPTGPGRPRQRSSQHQQPGDPQVSQHGALHPRTYGILGTLNFCTS